MNGVDPFTVSVSLFSCNRGRQGTWRRFRRGTTPSACPEVFEYT